MKKLIILFLALATGAFAQTTVFSDNFNISQGTSYSTSSTIGTTNWTINRSGVDWGAKIDNTILNLSNDASATTNADGWIFVYQMTSSFSSPFNSILSSNTNNINYFFNMRQLRTDPSGFGSGNYGVAFILGSSDNSRTAGNGYAIVLGQSGSTDPIRLVKFTNGLGGTITNLIVATSPLNDIGNEYLSIAVKYYPSTNTWELYGRNDGNTSFGDPSDGNLTLLGNITDNTYTNTSLNYFGAYWQGSTAANQTAFFDNVSVIIGDPPLPVELTSFTSNILSNGVELKWQTATEVNNYGFDIERSTDKQNWVKLGFVNGNGNSNSPKDYSFVDEDIKNQANGKYFYRLKQINTDGSYSYSSTIEINWTNGVTDVNDNNNNLPKEFSLSQNYPNPFNPTTKIKYTIPSIGNVETGHALSIKLKVYDILGNEIATLVNEEKTPGEYEVEFNGKGLSSGMYFYKIEAGNFVQVRKMIMMK